MAKQTIQMANQTIQIIHSPVRTLQGPLVNHLLSMRFSQSQIISSQTKRDPAGAQLNKRQKKRLMNR